MKVKIYLGNLIPNIITNYRMVFKMRFTTNPSVGDSFYFDIVRNGNTIYTIDKAFTSSVNDEFNIIIGDDYIETAENTYDNINTWNFPSGLIPEDTSYDIVYGDGYVDILIGIDTDLSETWALNISYNESDVEITSEMTTYETTEMIDNYDLIDLYDDENIEFTSKLSDIEKLSNVFTDFSNSFTVPATANNNELFKHYYDVDIDNTFNANIRAKGYLEIDSFPLRFGKIQLEGIKLKEHKPDSYKITFYGALIQLSDLFGDDTIDRLDYDKVISGNTEIYTKTRSNLSQYDFEYNSGNFINSLNLPTFKNGDLITPLIAYTDRDWNYGSDDSLDISINDGAILDSELFQALRISKIIEAIEAKYNINFSREFFGGANFNNLFMWLNGNETPLSVETPINIISGLTDSGSWSGPDIVIDDFIQLDTTNNYFTIFVPKIGSTVRDFQDCEFWIRPMVYNLSDTTTKFRVTARNYDTGEIISKSEIRTGNDTTSTTSLFIKLKQRVVDYTVRIIFNIELLNTATFDFRVIINMFITPSTTGPAYSDRIRQTLPNTQTIIANRTIFNTLPKMKVIEFLQGIMKMFKLIIRPTSGNNFYVNTLNGYYSEGNILDITQYVDNREVNIERPEIYKTIKFKYQKTNNVLGKKFRQNQDPTNDEIGYGDLRAIYNLIESKNELNVELPFENMLFERLTVLQPSAQAGEITDWIIGQSISTSDEITFSKNNSKPILFFNNGIVNNVDYPIKIKFGSTIGTLSYSYLIGNTNDELLDQVTDTINWGAEVDPWHNQIVENSLYLNYWSNWINTIYDLKQRKFTFEANLPPRYIEELSLNDRLIIGNQRYKINDYKINLLNGNTKLTLFKDIYDWNQYSFPLDINEPFMTVDRTEFICNAGKKYYSVNLNTNLDWYTTKADQGFGTDWIDILTPTGTGSSEVVFIVNEKASQLEPDVYEARTVVLTIKNDDFGDIDILITQNGLEE